MTLTEAMKIFEVPTYSGMEYRMLDFLFNYAKEKGINAKFDRNGNLYMTKGTVAKDEFYPCVSAHVDTVHSHQQMMIRENEKLRVIADYQPYKGDKANMVHVVTGVEQGIGFDDKSGIVIALSIMEQLDACKAVFFVEEETGMNGSKYLDTLFFRDVGYYIQFDSPELVGSLTLQGERLFTEEFYEKHMKPIMTQYGLTKFVDHPWTDSYQVLQKTDVMVINAPAGYYRYHSEIDYIIWEHVEMIIKAYSELIQHLGKAKYNRPKPKTHRSYGGPAYSKLPYYRHF